MLIYSFDTGIAKTGYAVIEVREGKIKVSECGLIITKKGKDSEVDQDDVKRRREIIKYILTLFKNYAFPNVISYEVFKPFQRMKRVWAIHATAGILETLAYLNNAYCIPVSPKKVKLAIIGKESATKQAMIDKVQEDYLIDLKKFKDDSEHVADAIGVGIAAYEEVKHIIELAKGF